MVLINLGISRRDSFQLLESRVGNMRGYGGTEINMFTKNVCKRFMYTVGKLKVNFALILHFGTFVKAEFA